jgi:hypothetical protein
LTKRQILKGDGAVSAADQNPLFGGTR